MIEISCEVNNDMNSIPYNISWFRNGMDLGFSGNLYTATESGTNYLKEDKNLHYLLMIEVQITHV